MIVSRRFLFNGYSSRAAQPRHPGEFSAVPDISYFFYHSEDQYVLMIFHYTCIVIGSIFSH